MSSLRPRSARGYSRVSGVLAPAQESRAPGSPLWRETVAAAMALCADPSRRDGVVGRLVDGVLVAWLPVRDLEGRLCVDIWFGDAPGFPAGGPDRRRVGGW